MAELGSRIGMEHVMALGAGTGALSTLAGEEGIPALIQNQLQTAAELHAEACQIIVQIINEELEAR